MKARLMNKFPNLPERFIEWALDASMYQVEKSERLLQEVGPQTPEEFKPFVVAAAEENSRQQNQPRRSECFSSFHIFFFFISYSMEVHSKKKKSITLSPL